VILDPDTATGPICEDGQTIRFLKPDDVLEIGGKLGSLGVTLRTLCR
jgi:hypothetical protein